MKVNGHERWLNAARARQAPIGSALTSGTVPIKTRVLRMLAEKVEDYIYLASRTRTIHHLEALENPTDISLRREGTRNCLSSWHGSLLFIIFISNENAVLLL